VLVIVTNTSAMRAQNAMRVAQAGINKSMERISTGKRINSVADDPANYFIAARMASDIAGMQQAERNVADGISMAQTADGVLGDVTDMLQRIRELATQASSGTYSGDDRANMQTEVGQLTAQIKQALSSSKFNGISLFRSTGGAGSASVTIQSGANGNGTKSVGIEDYDQTALDELNVGSADKATATLSISDTLLKAVGTSRARIGATMNTFNSTTDNLENSIINETDAYNRIMAVDYGTETTALAKNQLVMDAATAMLAQANSMPKKLVQMLLNN
jgi:flagellin